MPRKYLMVNHPNGMSLVKYCGVCRDVTKHVERLEASFVKASEENFKLINELEKLKKR